MGQNHIQILILCLIRYPETTQYVRTQLLQDFRVLSIIVICYDR